MITLLLLLAVGDWGERRQPELASSLSMPKAAAVLHCECDQPHVRYRHGERCGHDHDGSATWVVVRAGHHDRADRYRDIDVERGNFKFSCWFTSTGWHT